MSHRDDPQAAHERDWCELAAECQAESRPTRASSMRKVAGVFARLMVRRVGGAVAVACAFLVMFTAICIWFFCATHLVFHATSSGNGCVSFFHRLSACANWALVALPLEIGLVVLVVATWREAARRVRRDGDGS